MISPVVLPLLVPATTAVACLAAGRKLRLQRAVSVAGALLLLGSGLYLLTRVRTAGIASLQVGDWPFPFGITLAADLFSAVMVVGTGIVALCVLLYAVPLLGVEYERDGFHPVAHVLLLGVCGVFLTGGVFNMYVWFEVTLVSSFVLLVLGGGRRQLEGGIKYVTLNLLASVLFLTAIGLLYGITGSLNFADLSRILAGPNGSSGPVDAVAVLLFVAFGIKAAVFPLFFWLPASYPTPPAAVSALFAGVLTKVGVYAMLRLSSLLFMARASAAREWLVWIAGLTMVTGVLGALSQEDVRKVLSFHSVSQVGYMIMGLALLTPLAVAGAILFMVHHLVVKTNLFLVSGAVERIGGSDRLEELGGLFPARTGLAALFGLSALALTGIPPFSGFVAKLSLVEAGMEIGRYGIVGVALGTGLLTMMSMIKIWNGAFWKPAPPADRKDPEVTEPADSGGASGADRDTRLGPSPLLAMSLLAFLAVAVGVWAEPVLAVVTAASEQLLHPAAYLEVVAR